MARNDPPKPQNLASRYDLPWPVRRATSLVMRFAASPRRRDGLRWLRERRRRLSGAPHRIRYFHQVDDPYSHLAAQALEPLRARYEVEIVPVLVQAATGPNLPEPELLAALARRDAAAVAPHYALDFPPDAPMPAPELVRTGQRLLAGALGDDRFADRAVEVGRALWAGDKSAMEALAAEREAAPEGAADAALAEGNALRQKLGHYSGAMFHYAGEWYWGVDRLYHLERRLQGLGASRGSELLFPRPEISDNPVPRGGELVLEVFPSLRSPYTAIGFEPTVRLAERTGVRLVVRPVLPMVMRGVPVTMTKGLYIAADARREADALDMPFGHAIDPIGEPVRRVYSLWPWAQARGRGAELLVSCLRAAFSEATDLGSDRGLQRAVERAGLPWEEARRHLGDPAWEAEVEANRLVMVDELGIWGVPSFRLRGPAAEPDVAIWGQDRLWLIAREIQRRGRA
jgi:2-hydroxychromene-2-carboxylate isomerase